MNFIRILCFASLILASIAELNIKSPYSDVANKIQIILQNNRQSFAEGFKGLPALDPFSIQEPMKLNADPFRATVSNITVNGLSSYNETSLVILSNGIFFFSVEVPQVSVGGNITIPVGASLFTGKIQALLSNVWIAIKGYISVSDNQIALSEVHVDVTCDVSMVNVIGFPGNNKWINNFLNTFLINHLGNIINNDSSVYETALNDFVSNYLTLALGTSYSKLIYDINLLA